MRFSARTSGGKGVDLPTHENANDSSTICITDNCEIARVQGMCVRSFEMRNQRDAVDYYLFYATNNILGLKSLLQNS